MLSRARPPGAVSAVVRRMKRIILRFFAPLLQRSFREALTVLPHCPAADSQAEVLFPA